ncbi:MAG: TetR/AcrR family transcriptional regulator [Pseudomonadota bacterium]
MSRGRPRIHHEQTVLDATIDVLWREGVRGISLNQLAKETGIPKPVIANTVGCKDELIAQALTHYRERTQNDFNTVLNNAESLADLMQGYLAVMLERQTLQGRPPGCFLSEANRECARIESGPIREALDRINHQSQDTLIQALTRLGAAAPEDLARYLSAQGAAMSSLARNGASRAELEQFVELAARVVD